VKKGKRHTVGKGKKRKVRAKALPMAPTRYLLIPLPPRPAQKETP
jgi:hypothetical protein